MINKIINGRSPLSIRFYPRGGDLRVEKESQIKQKRREKQTDTQAKKKHNKETQTIRNQMGRGTEKEKKEGSDDPEFCMCLCLCARTSFYVYMWSPRRRDCGNRGPGAVPAARVGRTKHLHLESLILPLVCTIKIYNRIQTIYIIDQRLTANVDHLSYTVLLCTRTPCLSWGCFEASYFTFFYS